MREWGIVIFLLLIPLAPAGLALVHQGLGRSRSAAHTMLATLCAMAVAAVAFVAFGSAWAGYPGGAAHVLHRGAIAVSWLGAEPLFLAGVRTQGGNGALSLCLEIFGAAFVATIPISTGADRWRIAAICGASALMAVVIYPLFVHAAWGGGFLAAMPSVFGLPRFVDVGGAGSLQVVGGLAALSAAWVLGPRRGKYQRGVPSAIPGHNIVLVLFGCLLALVGWMALECASSLLFSDAGLEEHGPEQLVWILVNAILAAGSGLLAALVTTRVRYRKPDASISANGWIAGLVAGSAGCGLLTPAQMLLTGSVAGLLTALLVELFEMDLLVDDPGGAISVHAGAGLWGLLACGFLVPLGGPAATRSGMILTQFVGIATLLGLILPMVHSLNLLLNRVLPYRVDRDGDWQGMDVRELGSGAYPEFVMHADDFVPR